MALAQIAEPKTPAGPAGAAPERVRGQRAGAAGGRPLHIGIVTETFPPDVNGCAMTLGRLVDGLLVRGHSVQLIRPRGSDGDRERENGRLSILPLPGITIPLYPDQSCGLPVAGMVARFWRSNPPDVAYVATEGPLGAAASHVARRAGIPVVTGFHTNWISYTDYYGIRLLRPLVLGYLRAFHNRSARVLTPTLELQHYLEREGYRNVRVMSRGADTELFCPARRSRELREQWGVGAEGLAVAYVGRVAEEKNLGLAVRAFRAMQEANPSAKFILVGDGPARERLQVEHPDFVFCGMRRGRYLAEHYASADAFLFPSLTETFGNVTMEAAASGLAVVAFDYAAARMHLQHGVSGMLPDRECPEDFVEYAVRLARDAQLVCDLGSSARRVAEGISWDNICSVFEGVLADCARAA
jgi:glycosyltransferase involved in cell wall biosynthesis